MENTKKSRNSKFSIYLKDGSLIVGLVLEEVNAIVIAGDTRVLHGDVIYRDANGVEVISRKVLAGPNWVMAKCGRSLFSDRVYNIMNEGGIMESTELFPTFVVEMDRQGTLWPEDHTRIDLKCGVIVGLFEGNAPKLFGVDYSLDEGLVENQLAGGFVTDHAFDGTFADGLEDFLEQNYRPNMTLDEGKNLARRCVNRAAGAARGQGSQAIGGKISMAVLRPLTEAQRNAGVLINLEMTDEVDVKPEL